VETIDVKGRTAPEEILPGKADGALLESHLSHIWPCSPVGVSPATTAVQSVPCLRLSGLCSWIGRSAHPPQPHESPAPFFPATRCEIRPNPRGARASPLPTAGANLRLAGTFHTLRSNMTTVCPSPRPVICSVRPIPAKGKTAPTKGSGVAATREKHRAVHAISDEGGLISFRLGGFAFSPDANSPATAHAHRSNHPQPVFAFSPHCPGAHGPMRWVRLLTANERILSVKNAG